MFINVLKKTPLDFQWRINLTKYRVKITLKKPYTSFYISKPNMDIAIEGFADSLREGDVDEILKVEIVQVEDR